MKILYHYRIKSLFFFIYILMSSLSVVSQEYITWRDFASDNVLQGSFTGGTVTVVNFSLDNNDQTVLLSSPARGINWNLDVNDGDMTFFSSANGQGGQAKSLRINFSTAVIITRFNVSDIDRQTPLGGVRWDDSFNFGLFGGFQPIGSGVLCAPTTAGVVADHENVGNYAEYASWSSGCAIADLTINFQGASSNLTTADLGYSMQVLAFPLPQLGPFCVNSIPVQLPPTVNGVSGGWFPETINTAEVGDSYYTFTPAPGQILTCPFQIEIDILDANDCCVQNLTLASTGDDLDNNSPVAIKHRETTDWIKATNKINAGNNNLNDGVVYTAGNFIELNEGFEAAFQSQFTAYPKDCPGTFVYRPVTQTVIHPEPLNSPAGIAFYPNPASNVVDIVMNKNIFKKVIVLTIDGKKMLEKNFENGNKCQIDVSGYSKGLYIMNMISANGQSFSKKLIKN